MDSRYLYSVWYMEQPNTWKSSITLHIIKPRIKQSINIKNPTIKHNLPKQAHPGVQRLHLSAHGRSSGTRRHPPGRRNFHLRPPGSGDGAAAMGSRTRDPVPPGPSGGSGSRSRRRTCTDTVHGIGHSTTDGAIEAKIEASMGANTGGGNAGKMKEQWVRFRFIFEIGPFGLGYSFLFWKHLK